MNVVELFTSDKLSTLEIVSFSELMKKKQKHTNKLFSAIFEVTGECIILPNRLEEGMKLKEAEIIKQAKESGLKLLRRLTYGTKWELRNGYKYFSFVFDLLTDWKEIVSRLLKGLKNEDITLSNGDILANNELIGNYGTYSDTINTTVEFYLKNINLEKARSTIRDYFESNNYDILESSKLSIYDENLLVSIVNAKYNTDNWILDSRPPFVEGKCLIELLVAYPPTRYCKQFIELTKKAIAELNIKEKVELVIYERGRKGQMLKNMISTGILTAFKSHRIPALVVNGNLKASKTVPPFNVIKDSILEELHKLNLL